MLLPFYKLFLKFCGGKKKLFQRYNQKIINICSKYPNSEYVACVMFDEIPRYKFKREWFNSTIDIKFQNQTISCPISYHEVLRVEYGDNYMIPTRAKSKHGDTFFDIKNGYDMYKDLDFKEYNSLF